MEHDEARERVCLTCFNFIPFDRKKKGKLQKNAINLLENESRLEMVLKLLPTYNVKDVRLPCALCKNCNRQLSFLSCENRNPSLPKLSSTRKILERLPRLSRSSSSCLDPCRVCRAAQRATNKFKKPFLQRTKTKKRPRDHRPPLQDITNKFPPFKVSHEDANHIRSRRNLTQSQMLGVVSDFRQVLQDRKLVEPGLKEHIESKNHELDDIFEVVSSKQSKSGFCLHNVKKTQDSHQNRS